MSKITKEISTHLFKYVRTVEVTFNRKSCYEHFCRDRMSGISLNICAYLAFDRRTRSARELLRQVQSQRYSKANPKLKVITKVVGTVDPPSVRFVYVDGNDQMFDSQNYIAKEILAEVFQRANNLDIQFELDGKNVDER